MGVLGTMCMFCELIPDRSLWIHASCVLFQSKGTFWKWSFKEVCQPDIKRCKEDVLGYLESCSCRGLDWRSWKESECIPRTSPVSYLKCWGFFFIDCFLLTWGGPRSFCREGKLCFTTVEDVGCPQGVPGNDAKLHLWPRWTILHPLRHDSLCVKYRLSQSSNHAVTISLFF